MIEQPECSKRKCLHFDGVKRVTKEEMGERVVCKAFPKGIPQEIAYGENLHEVPLPDQKNKIVFKGK